MLANLIAKDTGLTAIRIRAVARSANHRYKIYSIPKRSGNGVRWIAHPSGELKVIQSWMCLKIFCKLPVHPAVYSYRTGIGIRQNAALHKDNRYLLRLDFRDFFPSIKTHDVASLITLHRDQLGIALDDGDMAFITSAVTYNGGLAIGAPSSPMLSNAILFAFDEIWSGIAVEEEFIYSRYADDLYFSTNKAGWLGNFTERVRCTLGDLRWPALELNLDKTVFSSKKRQRSVTGLILTSTDEVSLGRQKKREIRSQVYRFLQGDLDQDAKLYLKGFLAYANSVEPTFVASLRRKFGDAAIVAVMRGQ